MCRKNFGNRLLLLLLLLLPRLGCGYVRGFPPSWKKRLNGLEARGRRFSSASYISTVDIGYCDYHPVTNIGYSDCYGHVPR